MTLFRRRRSRFQRATKRARELGRHMPSAPNVPKIDLPQVSRPDMPSLPSLPSKPSLDVRKRVSRDTSGDTPLLSLAGGLMLGLFVGIIVAVILISRSEDEGASSARHTGITLLPHHEGEDRPEPGKSAAGIG